MCEQDPKFYLAAAERTFEKIVDADPADKLEIQRQTIFALEQIFAAARTPGIKWGVVDQVQFWEQRATEALRLASGRPPDLLHLQLALGQLQALLTDYVVPTDTYDD